MPEFQIALLQYRFFFYVSLIVAFTLLLVYMAYINLKRYRWQFTRKEDGLLKDSPYVPGISIVAPAYNEEKTIIMNVMSMLTLDYPLYEVVIVNDGSKDHTLELLIAHFSLVETSFAYIEKIKTRPVKRIFKSTNPEYAKLTVVDKINGGTKADASNAGINASVFPYFVCTDVDCILSRDALVKLIQPVLSSPVRVIAVGATLRMANSSEINENGVLTHVRPPKDWIPCFQEIEYLRSYLISKLGWSFINAVPNVSGGLGLFDKGVVIEAGGYEPTSHAEDMDMMLRMIAYMKDYNQAYRVLHIPITACWTEGPPGLAVLNRQRTRWARGLFQLFVEHRKYLFNRKYGRMGLVTLPYILIFEFLAPVFELVGIFTLLYFALTGQINTSSALILFAYIYLMGVFVSLMAILFDIRVKKWYRTFREYTRLLLFSMCEFLVYHPFIVFFSLKGYVDYLSRQNFEWGAMKRQGFKQQNKKK